MKERAITSVTRAFEILEYFRTEQRPLALKDLVEHFSYPTTSTADLLKSLYHLGYLTFSLKSMTYVPAPKLYNLTSWMSSELALPPVLMESMKALRRSMDMNIFLVSTNDIWMFFITHVSAEGVTEIVRKAPLLRSVTGMALLSVESELVVERTYSRTIAQRLITRAEVPMSDLTQRLRRIREAGHYIAPQRGHPNIAVAAVPVPNLYCGRPMAIAASGPVERITENASSILATLRQFLSTHFQPWSGFGIEHTEKHFHGAVPWATGRSNFVDAPRPH